MPFEIVRNDITKMKVDVIVNPTNRALSAGGGLDAAIHKAAGPDLSVECRSIGSCQTGDAIVTKGYKLPARYVIHTVGPIWHGGSYGEKALLTACYQKCLALASELGCESIAFPLISAGTYGYPKDEAMSVALAVISKFLFEHDMLIYLVVFGRSEYFSYCTRNLPKPNIFDLAGIQAQTKLKLYDKGIVSFEDIETTQALKGDKMLQVQHELHDLPPAIDRNGIVAFLDQLSYPLYFLDFESFQSAIPPYDNTSPYQQIVFQYSLHYIECEGGKLKHREHLGYPFEDPRRRLAEQLCQDIPLDVCTMAYNMRFEKGRIRDLAKLYPDLSEHLMNIHDHIVDLMVPFRQRQFYCRAMQGSYSIKYVLPALFPGSPELDYHNLEGVHDGGEASTAFVKMKDMPPEETDAVRSQLLMYCGLDTLAMVRVWEKLVETATGASVREGY